MARKERKYLAHFIDVNCNKDPENLKDGAEVEYQRIGQDLEAFAEELNPQVEVRKNILGEQTVVHNGYEVQSAVDPFYAEDGNPLYARLETIANKRENGDNCRTTRIEAMFADGEFDKTTIESKWAWREDCWIVPNSFGGDTSGVQIPFQVLNCGNRVEGTMTGTKNGATITWTFQVKTAQT